MSRVLRVIVLVIPLILIAVGFFVVPRRQTANPAVAPPMKPIWLYYYNEQWDRELGNGDVACSEQAVLPVPREIVRTVTPVQDAVRALLNGELTQDDKAHGFRTEFPRAGFQLRGANLANGVLTLEFTEVPGFTDGGSCRVGLLAAQIRKTALQFPGVREVRFLPETLFQP